MVVVVVVVVGVWVPSTYAPEVPPSPFERACTTGQRSAPPGAAPGPTLSTGNLPESIEIGGPVPDPGPGRGGILDITLATVTRGYSGFIQPP